MRWLPRESHACRARLQAIPRRMRCQQKYPLPRKDQHGLSSVTHPELQPRNWKSLIEREESSARDERNRRDHGNVGLAGTRSRQIDCRSERNQGCKAHRQDRVHRSHCQPHFLNRSTSGSISPERTCSLAGPTCLSAMGSCAVRPGNGTWPDFRPRLSASID